LGYSYGRIGRMENWSRRIGIRVRELRRRGGEQRERERERDEECCWGRGLWWNGFVVCAGWRVVLEMVSERASE